MVPIQTLCNYFQYLNFKNIMLSHYQDKFDQGNESNDCMAGDY